MGNIMYIPDEDFNVQDIDILNSIPILYNAVKNSSVINEIKNHLNEDFDLQEFYSPIDIYA